MKLRCFLSFGLAVSVGALPSWPIMYSYSPDTMPVMSVRLAPPRHPLPEVAALLGEERDEIEKLRHEELAKVEHALNVSLSEASKTLPALVDRLMHVFSPPSAWIASGRRSTLHAPSFREARKSKHEMTTRINVLPAPSLDASIMPMIKALDGKRSRENKARFGQALDELPMLTKIVEMAAEAEISREVEGLTNAQGHGLKSNVGSFLHTASFLQQPVKPSGPQLTANVRVGPSNEPFPTIRELVEDLERERDGTQESAEKRIQELQLQLLHAENTILEDTLQGWVHHILQSGV